MSIAPSAASGESVDRRVGSPSPRPSPRGEGAPECGSRNVRALWGGLPSGDCPPSPRGEGRGEGERVSLIQPNGNPYNVQRPPGALSLVLELRDPAGKVVKDALVVTPVEAFSGTKAMEFVTHVSQPLPWSAEKPQLYRLRVELRRGGTTIERIERNLGFRNIEIRGRQVYVNGKRVKLAGACHHETDPLTGRADTARHAQTDVRLLKEANLNYIRTSHYPPNAELLDGADRLGMYVEVEAPFCWVGGALDNPTNLFATLTPTSA